MKPHILLLALALSVPIPLTVFLKYQRYSSEECSYGTFHIIDLRSKKEPPPLPIVTIHTPSSTPTYPWKDYTATFSPITKEYFRCRGSPLNPPIPSHQDGKVVSNTFDCRGTTSHSLPIRNGKEFIYPVLFDLLNYLQTVMKKAVVITSGHRCQAHNKYVDGTMKNQFSKHLIGAAVSFYVKGAERHPESVIACIEQFYRTNPKYLQHQKEYIPLTRYTKESDTSIKPWMNKEIFLKYYLPSEGRNGDNKHPYGYFSLQVRFDRERQLSVTVDPKSIEMYEY